MKILKGEYNDPHTSIWWYKLDSIDEIGNPDMWLKANPNLGKTVSYETYHWMWKELKIIRQQEMIFLPKDLVFQWRDLLIISHMKKRFPIGKENTGSYLVRWVLICPRVMTSVLSYSYFRSLMVLSV